VAALQALRGIGLISTVIIMAEIGDLRRFDNPRQLMDYLTDFQPRVIYRQSFAALQCNIDRFSSRL
jgi:hypothetical protein